MTVRRPLRVAHVVGAMNRAGVETWLMNVARRTRPEDVELTFVVHSSTPSDYDDEIRALGHRVAVVPSPHRPAHYVRNLYRLLRRTGVEFDAVHSHVGHFSAVPLAVAWAARVPVRIAHSHSDNRSAQRTAGAVRRVYFATAAALIRATATVGLASSDGACRSLFRRDATVTGRFRVLPTGIDLDTFDAAPDLRTELGLGESTLVLGHVARFTPVKNHGLVVEIAKELAAAGTDVHLVLVGEGPLRADVERAVHDAKASAIVSFLGVRADVPRLLSTFDLLLLPSRYEGVPIVLLEAQASGCPCLVSSGVGAAVDVVPGLITRLDIDEAPARWVAEALRIARDRARGPRAADALAHMRASAYNIDVTADRLLAVWSGGREGQ